MIPGNVREFFEHRKHHVYGMLRDLGRSWRIEWGYWTLRLSSFFVSHRKRLLLCGLLGLALLLFLGIYQFFWVIPNQQIAAVRIAPDKIQVTTKEFYELRNSIRQTFVQALGGAALLLGLYFTAQTLRTSQEALRISQEGQITERFSNAIEHLGDKKRLTVRLGGIYALERVARDSPQDQWQIMEVLTAYVRDNAPWPPKDARPQKDGQARDERPTEKNDQRLSSSESSSPPQPATDIQAALTVLVGRSWVRDRERRKRMPSGVPDQEERKGMPLARTDLRCAQLEGAILVDAHLEGANLAGAHLEGAILAFAHLEGANLADAHLQSARLPYARLEGAILAGTHLQGTFLPDAHLERADFRGAHLEGTFLQRAHLEGAKNLTDVQLSAARTLRGASLDPPFMTKFPASIERQAE